MWRILLLQRFSLRAESESALYPPGLPASTQYFGFEYLVVKIACSFSFHPSLHETFFALIVQNTWAPIDV